MDEDELDELLAYSGSEYEPSNDGSEISSEEEDFSQNEDSDSENNGGNGKRRKLGNSNKKRKMLRPYQINGRNKVNKPPGDASGSSIDVTFRLFSQLMNGVVFAMSGFENPVRSILRGQAIEMGARYMPDWENSCTHLVCAFKNTPKYYQVKGNGKIVKKEWVEDCYSQRKRCPWRRYALDWRDGNMSESEGEILEVGSVVTSRSDVTNQDEDSNDSSIVNNLDEESTCHGSNSIE